MAFLKCVPVAWRNFLQYSVSYEMCIASDRAADVTGYTQSSYTHHHLIFRYLLSPATL